EESFFTQEGQRSLLTEGARLAEEDRSYRFYLALREAPERIVGLVGLNNLVRGAFQSCFLGYKLDGGLMRRGYMTEAVEEAVRIAFTVLGLHRIEA
ncbi:GNAT family N-acetyltransferase, partial [Intestinimonas massiliensis]|uniref:GNAT family N-acetyltransferase n=1 Tax=Intestinimonas massiliensis (ex Afouda et al. 2020) TaxID=1673721 RepID=UPI00210EC55B